MELNQQTTIKKSDPDRNSVFGHGFAEVIDRYDWEETLCLVRDATEADVLRVLAKAERNREATLLRCTYLCMCRMHAQTSASTAASIMIIHLSAPPCRWNR